jgi:hypothetical protein
LELSETRSTFVAHRDSPVIAAHPQLVGGSSDLAAHQDFPNFAAHPQHPYHAEIFVFHFPIILSYPEIPDN